MEQLVTTGSKMVALQTLTEKNLLEIYTPQSIRTLQANLKSCTDLIRPENNTPSLAYIAKKMNNPLLAVTIVKLHLLEMNDFVNATRKMSDAQIEQTAELILSEYPTFKIADIIFTFKEAKIGRFGPLYEGLDGMKVLKWFDQIMSDRCDAGENQSLNEHGQFRKEIIGMVGNERKDAVTEFKELLHNAKVMEATGKIQRNEPLKPIE